MQKRGWWKIDQANDRQTEKKGLAELLGRCLAARRLASAAELNTSLLMLIVFAYLSFSTCVFEALFW